MTLREIEIITANGVYRATLIQSNCPCVKGGWRVKRIEGDEIRALSGRNWQDAQAIMDRMDWRWKDVA